MHDDKFYQDILDAVLEKIPEDWNRIVFFAAYLKNAFHIDFYYKNEDVPYCSLSDMNGINENERFGFILSLNEMIQKKRKQLDDKNRWNVMTLIVNGDGEYKAEFGYEDISETILIYEKEWRNRYLI